MKLNLSYCLILTISIIINKPQIVLSQPDKNLVNIPAEQIIDKIRGGMLGQIIGNLNGLPHEMVYINEPGNVKNFVPSLKNGAWTDDDTDFEWVYITEMQKHRNAFLPSDTIFRLWKERINRRIWCSNRFARHLMDLGIKPPYTGYITLNPWAEFNISGQFLCETFGLIAPIMPQTAARIALNYTRVTIDQEPAQTTQFFTSMIATAFQESDIETILKAGIAALDPESEILKIVGDIRQWYDMYPNDWKETRRLLKEKYTLENGGIRDKNGFRLNTGAIIAALLYGNGDFQETLKMSFNFGWDADCNAATAGTIIGVIKGYRWMLSQGWDIVDRYRNVTRDHMPMDETITSYCDRLVDVFEIQNEKNGGKKAVINNTVVYQINAEISSPVTFNSSLTDQKKSLLQELKPTIISNIQTGSRKEKAKSAYLAVVLDLSNELSEKFPVEWKEATLELSGYFKIMKNIFNGASFKGMDDMKEKFITAGFKPPRRIFTDDEIYGDEYWKVPDELYE